MAYQVIVVDDQKIPRRLFELIIGSSERYRLLFSLDTAGVTNIYCTKYKVDLILMDVVMGDGSNGIDEAKRIKKVSPETKIIIVTSMPEVSYIRRAREAGVDSFWYKEVSAEPLLEVMDRTMAGESVYPDCPPELMLGCARSSELTEREIEVLREMTTGASNGEIAEKLCVDISTVKSHISHMLQKTGLRNRTELSIRARVSGLVIGGENIDGREE
ncbi:response regulator transcription factor [Lachnoclostridium sp. Marseille-P6806]|uniref:response regulator transcription factor n=1 Tax=Lachnoclostridium sp. Marseille-P6806 TaxID=2364793 RepID=UPI00103208F7|nr:response regulator transcription factor [Lachnoclostridium sp. Marseille-P6806]